MDVSSFCRLSLLIKFEPAKKFSIVRTARVSFTGVKIHRASSHSMTVRMMTNISTLISKMEDLFESADQNSTDKSLNINAILTAVCKNKALMKQTAAELSVDEKALEKFLINHIFVTENIKTDNVMANNEAPDFIEDKIGDSAGVYSSAVLHTDGGSRGNPGTAGCGIIIEYENGPKVGYYYYLGEVTNNEAEYAGLVKGLTILSEMKVKKVDAFADSELMCNQINGKYKVKHPVLKTYYEEAKKLISSFQSFSMTHVLREKNKDADKMANRAMDLKKDGETKWTVAE